jgi:hypothetical protein
MGTPFPYRSADTHAVTFLPAARMLAAAGDHPAPSEWKTSKSEARGRVGDYVSIGVD